MIHMSTQHYEKIRFLFITPCDERFRQNEGIPVFGGKAS